ncbi:hypothetical protein [Williamsia sp.]|uniref:hypothetical protein n=1 Tax=Williamsia sp. TaxID=1872085 RepID=UPI002F95A466
MWDYEGFLGKAEIYFRRAAEHGHSDDDEFAIWHLLGFEFLLRAPLAKVHPSLLADNASDSLLAANGIATDKQAKSAMSTVVIERLKKIVPEFAGDPERDSGVLMGLRNAELHTSDATVSDVPNALWLPKLVRIAKVLCKHLEIDVHDLLDNNVVKLGENLLDEADKKIEQEVRTKINAAHKLLKQLSQTEIDARVTTAKPTGIARLGLTQTATIVKCPVCQNSVYAPKTYVRSTPERLEDDEAVHDNIFLINELKCQVCGLDLPNAAELVAAGLRQQVIETDSESLEDRYGTEPELHPEYDGPEYMDE